MRYVDPTGEFAIAVPLIPVAVEGLKVAILTTGVVLSGILLGKLATDIINDNQEKSENQKAGNVRQQLESNAQATAPNPMPPDDDENKKKPSSQNQLQKQGERGQAPRDVDRVDKPHQKGQQPHVHFKDKTSLNQDGTVHDAHNGIPSPSNEVKNWLRNNGWNTGE